MIFLRRAIGSSSERRTPEAGEGARACEGGASTIFGSTDSGKGDSTLTKGEVGVSMDALGSPSTEERSESVRNGSLKMDFMLIIGLK
jgi:hypothetical protein